MGVKGFDIRKLFILFRALLIQDSKKGILSRKRRKDKRVSKM